MVQNTLCESRQALAFAHAVVWSAQRIPSACEPTAAAGKWQTGLRSWNSWVARLRCHARAHGFLLALVIGVTLGLGVDAKAAAVAEVSVDEMLLRAGLVFEGRVLSREARRSGGRHAIRTFVTFEVVDVIKGSWDADTIELSFLGGVVDGIGLRVAGMVIPEPGEQGIYFVESTSEAMVQPFFGWTQGEFRVVKDPNGTARVMTRGGKPVRSVMPARVARRSALSSGVARGIETAQPGHIDEAMTPGDFKLGLRERLRALGK